MSIEEKIERFTGEALMKGKNKVVLVEDFEDENFWRIILEAYVSNAKLDFPYWGGSGKDGLLKDFGDHASKRLLLCVDTDNEQFITCNYTHFLRPRRKYIYQTYSHSFENHCIYPENLEKECKELTRQDYSFNGDFAEFSVAVYEWLALWMFCRDKENEWVMDAVEGLRAELAWGKFEELFEEAFEKAGFEESEDIESAKLIFTELKILIRNHSHQIINSFIENGFEHLQQQLLSFKDSLPFEPEESLFFVRGHSAFKLLILYFQKMVQLLSKLSAEQATTIDRRNHWEKQASKDYRDRLLTSYRLCLIPNRPCSFMEKIRADLISDFGN